MECAESETAPVANPRLHQTRVVPSDDARGGGVASSLPAFNENRGRSGRIREGSRFRNRLKWCRDPRLAPGVQGRGTVPLGLAGGLPVVATRELSRSWSLMGQLGDAQKWADRSARLYGFAIAGVCSQ
jgi:hypothetical protein